MSYRALYRVWRPQTFSDLIGQEHVTQTLKNALSEGHFSHAYLFSGPRGTGKTSAAKIMAKAVNCLRGPAPEPCNDCEACSKITDASLMDVVEIDAASNRGVDEIRDLRDKVKYAPTEVRYKVYIVDEVHMLTAEAFNALLKTLEEPPEHVIFILATTEPHKLPSTIISRCQRFSFRRIAKNHMLARLHVICDAQGIEADDSALAAVVQAADGGMRDALSLLDQVLAFSKDRIDESAVLAVTGSVSRQVLGDLLESVVKRDAATALDRIGELLEEGLEAERLVQDLIHLCRDLLVMLAAPELEEVKNRMSMDERWTRLSEAGSVESFHSVLDTLIRTQQQMKWAAHPRILLEMAVVQLCQGDPSSASSEEVSSGEQPDLLRLKKRVQQLEERLAKWSGAAAPASAPSPQVSPPSPQERPSPPSAEPAPSPSLDRFLRQASAECLQRVRQQWPEVLSRVKEQKITVHAWLINGEPVAATENSVLVAFKNSIHRETTEKEANKSIIQQVMSRIFGSSQQLVTVMSSDWDRYKASSEISATTDDAFESRSESEEKADPVQRAVDWFGEEMIEVTD
ncbi:DNA polymerase III subunit gamma/tau [Paludifilum halophilum]|uniref:DNA polymerase III subunit gamma/tau n=1 Tax=Paludifilum halophilum TaxID=1642702 RepID=UPI00146D817D|nr:DNA polymerase III subunit gamma/tau [Paludifilum halophilum]